MGRVGQYPLAPLHHPHPGGVLEQEFSTHEIRPGTFLFGCTRKPIHSLAELELAEKYEPRMPASYPAFIREQVAPLRQATSETMRVGKPGGGFIIQNADFLEYGTPLENVEAFVSTALKEAAYG